MGEGPQGALGLRGLRPLGAKGPRPGARAVLTSSVIEASAMSVATTGVWLPLPAEHGSKHAVLHTWQQASQEIQMCSALNIESKKEVELWHMGSRNEVLVVCNMV